jgi:hypothetical protein
VHGDGTVVVVVVVGGDVVVVVGGDVVVVVGGDVVVVVGGDVVVVVGGDVVVVDGDVVVVDGDVVVVDGDVVVVDGDVVVVVGGLWRSGRGSALGLSTRMALQRAKPGAAGPHTCRCSIPAGLGPAPALLTLTSSPTGIAPKARARNTRHAVSFLVTMQKA